MNIFIKPSYLLVISCAFFCSACAQGLIYTNVTEPYDTNMTNTPIGKRIAYAGGITKLSEPFSGAKVSVEVNSNAIGDIAKEGGLDKIYYADLHTKSILFGIWEKKTLILYGK